MDTHSPYSDFQALYSQLSLEEKNERLLKAAKEGKSNLIPILIKSGANILVKDKKHMTPFLCAVQAGHTECALVLLEYHPNAFYDVDKDGDSALTIALWNNRLKTFDSLFNLPGKYLSADMLYAALVTAAINDHPKQAQMLIERGADIHKRHADDNSIPLMTAVVFESVGVVELLINKGSDVKIFKNNTGENVLDLVKICNNTTIKELFLNLTCSMPTPKIYPVLPSCPTFVPPCYQPIISQDLSNDGINTDEFLYERFNAFSLYQEMDLKPSAPPLSDLFPGIEPKRNKRKSPNELDESHRKIKKNRKECASDYLSEFCFDEVVAEKELRKGIAALSLYDTDIEVNNAIVTVVTPPITFIAELRTPKRRAENDLIKDNEKIKKARI